MNNFLVYLAGPISGLTYGDCTEWREYVKSKFPDHISSLSPMRGKQRLKEQAEGTLILNKYEGCPLTTAKGINVRDYNDCKRADLILVNMLGAKNVSIGTVMEVAWARSFQIPVVLVMEKDNIHNHSMFLYACGFVTDNLDEAIDLVKVILGPDKILE